MRPGGVLLLLALLRWRRPEARLLAALACVPHLAVLYDTVPLFLACRARWEAWLLVALSYVTLVVTINMVTPGMGLVAALARTWPALLLLMYLPVLVLVLRGDRPSASLPRPSEAR